MTEVSPAKPARAWRARYGADVGDSAKLDGIDQPLEEVAEQLALLLAVASSQRQKQRPHPLGRLGAPFRRACDNRRLDFGGEIGLCLTSLVLSASIGCSKPVGRR
jgi:hypothetical protein